MFGGWWELGQVGVRYDFHQFESSWVFAVVYGGCIASSCLVSILDLADALYSILLVQNQRRLVLGC